MTNGLRHGRRAGVLAAGLGPPALAAVWLLAAPATAQDGTSPASPAAVPTTITIKCSSKPGERQHCPADTSKGVALARSAGEVALPARQDVGLRRPGHLGVGRLQRRVRRRPGAAGGDGARPRRRRSPRVRPQRRVPARSRARRARSTSGSSATSRYLNQKGLDPTYTDSFGNTHDRAAARGHPAQQVLPALLRLVPDAEVPLLPLRLVVEHLAGRSRPGRGRRQPELHLQPVRDPGRRHHVPSQRAQHRGPVPLLARRRRPADRRRVLPRLVHHRASGSRASSPPSSSTWRCSPTT